MPKILILLRIAVTMIIDVKSDWIIMWDQLQVEDTRLLTFESLNTAKMYPWRFSHQHTNESSLLSTSTPLPIEKEKYQIQCRASDGLSIQTSYSIQLVLLSSRNKHLAYSPVVTISDCFVVIKISRNNNSTICKMSI